jgi:hypothetical protein
MVEPDGPQMKSQYGAYELQAESARLHARIHTPNPTHPGTRMHANAHTDTNIIFIALPRRQ